MSTSTTTLLRGAGLLPIPLLLAFLLLWGIPSVMAANVVVSPVDSGEYAPKKTFIGTVFYSEISDLSAEVAGAVLQVHVEEGRRVEPGDRVVTLDSSMLEQMLLARKATYEQTLSDLERARRDLERARTLYARNIIPEREFDDHRFAVLSLEKRAASLRAEVERLEIEKLKTTIRAPFRGIVVKKYTSRGEWVSPGKPVATIADDNSMEVIVSVPETMLTHLHPGLAVPVTTGAWQLEGTILTIIPRGDIATRTFPVKILVANNSRLMEGMEARVMLPEGDSRNVLLLHRDALLNVGGETSVVVVRESTAYIVPVRVVGYRGLKAAIEPENLEEGSLVVVKGNERLRDNQAVTIIEELR